jgi:predicted nucleic acid-binding protein
VIQRLVAFHDRFFSTPQVKECQALCNKFIECAVALKARFLVSRDKHLTGIKDYMRIKIISPKEFLGLARNADKDFTAIDILPGL